MLEQRRRRRVLAAVERPLVLPDHDRVPPPVRVRERGHEGGGPRAPRPRQDPALPGVEELRHDHPAPRRQHHGLRQLPGPRRHRILPVLGRDPPVERKPRGPPAAGPLPAAGQALRPRRQRIPSGPLTPADVTAIGAAHTPGHLLGRNVRRTSYSIVQE